jgi:hypothetical protein
LSENESAVSNIGREGATCGHTVDKLLFTES